MFICDEQDVHLNIIILNSDDAFPRTRAANPEMEGPSGLDVKTTHQPKERGDIAVRHNHDQRLLLEQCRAGFSCGCFVRRTSNSLNICRIETYIDM